jgi:hypothetical protein
MPPPKFSLGSVVATPGTLAALEEANQDALHFLGLHVTGAWGDLCIEDRQANEAAIAHEGNVKRQARVVSSYRTRTNAKLWVITESDRSVTTLLLPEEY